MHRALEVEMVEHGPADQADQQRVAPCRKGVATMCSPDKQLRRREFCFHQDTREHAPTREAQHHLNATHT